ncbi:hypothetical protein ABB29_02920 [Pseudoxanthomonas dokdonensis]|uniref:HAMP domain-containing protein n=1 Tax=Pseudoxanthomonas dokdonensis TaxID=344882 RepID=A0A0R0CP58_9GAMM|nr:hypothetical protein ABB29_02920 [Pseudoxanthomonas dokdonensis]
MAWWHSLRMRIALWAGVVNVLLVLLLTAAMSWFAHSLIVDNARRNTVNAARDTAGRLDNALRSVTVTTQGLSELVVNSQLTRAELTTTLRAMVKATPGSTGGSLVLEPHKGEPAFARYISASGRERDRDLIAAHYDYQAQPWYQRTLASPGGWWSEPYFSETAGGIWMVTYNMPVRGNGRRARTLGMLSQDLPLDYLTRNFRALAELPGWRVRLVAPEGTLAYDPSVGVQDSVSLVKYIRDSGRPDLQPALEAIRLQQPLELTHVDAVSKQAVYTMVQPVGQSGWTLMIGQSYSLVMARLHKALALLIVGGVLVALLCMFVVRKLAKRISRPMEELTESARYLEQGYYDTAVAHTGRRDEVGLLARTLDHARTSIQQQLDEIEEMGAARQKMESELAIARDIQLSMLSPGRQLQAGGHTLEAHALLEPAKQVGGDFYSFIEAEGQRLWFAIGDVSDKGVPAALFMARTVTVLEVAACSGASPSDVLVEASKRLVEGNDTCMFATVLCGYVDIHSGYCVLASAGHEAPLIVHANGHSEFIPVPAGAPLGFEVSDSFAQWRGQLLPGSTLLAYTDGVTEAFNPVNEAFGEQALLQATLADSDALRQCQHLVERVHAFARPAEQSDDITVLAIRLCRDDVPSSPERP